MRRCGIPLTVFFISLVLCNQALAAEQFNVVYSGFRMLGGLLVVLALIFSLQTLLRKRVAMYQKKEKGIIKIVETKHLAPKKSLMLVEVRGKEFLVGGGADSISAIVPLSAGEKTDETKALLTGTQVI